MSENQKNIQDLLNELFAANKLDRITENRDINDLLNFAMKDSTFTTSETATKITEDSTDILLEYEKRNSICLNENKETKSISNDVFDTDKTQYRSENNEASQSIKRESPDKIITERPPRPPPKSQYPKIYENQNLSKIVQQQPPIPSCLLPPRRVIIERLPELPTKPQDVCIERWLPFKDQKRKITLRPRPNDPAQCKCKIRNIIISWNKLECAPNVKNVVKNLGVEKTNPSDYSKTHGNKLFKSNEFPNIVNEIIKEQDGGISVTDNKVKYYSELEGDIHGVLLIQKVIDDLDKEGLSDLKSYIQDMIAEEKLKKNPPVVYQLPEKIDVKIDEILKFSEADVSEMKTFFNSFNQSIELQDLDSFLLKMGANLATAQPHELFALFKQLETAEMSTPTTAQGTVSQSNDNFLYNMASQLMNGARNYTEAGLALAGTALLGGSLYYYLNSNVKKRSNPLLDTIDHRDQSRDVKNRDDSARISNINKTDILLSNCFQDGKTLYENFLRGLKRSNDGEFLGSRKSTKEPFSWLKYSEVNEMAEKIGSAFIHFGLRPAKESCVGIFAKNRPEWVITEMACNAYSFITIPLYDTLGDEAIDFILMQSELRVVICDDSSKAMHLMNSKSNLQYIIVIEEIKEEVRVRAEELNIVVYSFAEIQEIGTANLKRPIPPDQNDVATICYTSGTTGQPKGALITHSNIISIVSSMYLNLEQVLDENETHRYLSYLPLAHMLERVSQGFIIGSGGKIGFYQGDIKILSEDLRDLKPTIFCTVPRLLNRIYAKVTSNLDKAPFYKKLLFKWAFANKEQEVLKGIVRNNSIYDFIFKQIRESLGGSVKFILTGSAPISPDVLQFLRVVCGCHVLEGYGATETGGACGVQIPGESTVGNVGPPFACCMYKLIDVPSMNLEVKRDNKGEICVFGTNVFKGYYKDEEKTREALDSEGWYHTGDIGIWEKNGTLKIVDRVKNIFKLQQGEYVAPEKIENIYVRSKYVAQAFVYGNSYKSSIIGVIVPEETVLFEWAKSNNLEMNLHSLCADPIVKKLIMDDLEIQAKSGGLKGFEKVKDIYLHDELFSIENGLLTPTMKSKRNELQKRFQTELDIMNKSLD